jgi:hypothetical protein
MRVLFTNAHVTMAYDEARGFFRYSRSHAPFATLDELREAHDRVELALPKPMPHGARLLADVREAPPRNDEAFEAEMTRKLGSLMRHFAARAVLVKSAVGRLQVQRLGRPYGEGRPAVFDDEAKALRHLGV